MSDLPLPARPVLGRALSAFGALVIAAILLGRAGTDPRWATVAGVTAAALWLVCALLTERGRGRLRFGLLLATVLISAPTAAPTEVTGLVPALVAIIAVVALPRRSFSLVVALPLAAVALVAVGFLLGGGTAGSLLGSIVAVALALVVGISRAQSRRAEEQALRLLEQQVVVEQERARSAALGERSRIARDLHDVLAHSLGGLVIQLDAVDALLEADRMEDAAVRVRAARSLAADGLDEARRAVDALREPDEAADLSRVVTELVGVHRSLGAAADLEIRGDAGPLAPEAAGALRRATQEVLSNARRHAPGRPTSLVLTWEEDAVVLSATTPLADGRPMGGGSGRGLLGMRERLRSVGGEAIWGVTERGFSVEARAPR